MPLFLLLWGGVLQASAVAPVPQTAEQGAPNCAFSSVTGLAMLLGRTIDAATAEALHGLLDGPATSLLQVKQALAAIAIPADGVRAQLSELADLDVPMIVHLQDPDHFCVLVDIREDRVRLMETPDTIVTMAADAFARRYGGEAMLPRFPTGGPRIGNTPTSHHFDPVPAGRILDCSFVITNIGHEVLSIRVRGTSCGCTTVSPNTREIPPGGSTTLSTSVKTGVRGPFSHRVYLETNDPRRPQVVLTVAGSALQQLTLLPRSLVLKGSRGTTVRRTVFVDGPADFVIKAATPLSDHLQVVECGKLITDGGVRYEYTLTATLAGTMRDEMADVVFETSSDAAPTLRLPVRLQVQPALTTYPSRLFLGGVEVGEEIQIRLDVRLLEGGDGRLSVSTSVPGLVAQVISQADHHAVVQLAGKCSTEGVIAGTVKIDWLTPDPETIEVPVVLDVRGRE